MVVGVCRVSLMIEESQSLKDKRAVLRRIKDRVSNKYNCAIAEVGDPDLWQSAQLGFTVVSNQRGFTQSMVQKILQFIEDLAVAKVIDDEQDYIDYGEEALEDSSRGDYPHWEPDEPSPPLGRSAIVKPQKLATVDYPWDSPVPTTSDGAAPLEVAGVREPPRRAAYRAPEADDHHGAGQPGQGQPGEADSRPGKIGL